MNNSEDKKIFFHVGLGKTASTYMQYKVFPHFENVEYIHHKHRYDKAPQIVAKSSAERYLISREFDHQLEREVSKFAKHYPDTTAIIVFRRQDGWIASQYRRAVKNGHIMPFSEFFDLENDNGAIFKKIDLTFYHYLETIEKYFTKKPVVLFYDDLRKDPFAFFDYIANVVGVKYDKSKIDLSSKHKSYNEKQLKTIIKVGEVINLTKDSSKWYYQIRRFYTNMIRYSTLFVGKFLPDSWFDSKPIIDPSELEAVKKYFEDDWKRVHEYAEKNNPVF